MASLFLNKRERDEKKEWILKILIENVFFENKYFRQIPYSN